MRRLGTGEVTASPEIVDWMRDLYDGEVAAADYAFASLVGELRVRGLYDSSIVVVTADHGEELYEHGGWEHGKTLFAEVLDVPLIVRLPGGARGRRVAAPVQQIDLMPTLLEAAGVEAPKESPRQIAVAAARHRRGRRARPGRAALELRRGGRVAASTSTASDWSRSPPAGGG